MAATPRIPTATETQSRRWAVFLGSELRRAGTRFCARRKGDCWSTSRSIRRASSSVSRVSGGEFPAYGGYNSSCKMVELDFRAISSGQLSPGIAELLHYSRKSRNEIREKLRDLHRREPRCETQASGFRRQGFCQNYARGAGVGVILSVAVF